MGEVKALGHVLEGDTGTPAPPLHPSHLSLGCPATMRPAALLHHFSTRMFCLATGLRAKEPTWTEASDTALQNKTFLLISNLYLKYFVTGIES